MKRLALIGVSGYARTHAILAREQVIHNRAHLSAVTIINPEQEPFLCRRLSALGTQVFLDTRQMWEQWAGRIDLCLIPTGIHWHYPMVMAALEAGANVLVEKPLAGSVEEGFAIRTAEKNAGRFVAVAFQDVYTPAAQAIKRRLISGEFGRLNGITLLGMWPRSTGYYTRNDWAGRLHVKGRPVFDSPVSNAFAHFFHLALFWSAPEFAASARIENVEAALWRVRPIESFDTAAVYGRTSEGVAIQGYVTHASRESHEVELVVETDRARITWRHLLSCVIEWRDGTTESICLLDSIGARLVMMDAVMNRLDNPEQFVCSTTMALAHAKFVEQIHQAGCIQDVPLEAREISGSQENSESTVRGLHDLFLTAARKHLHPHHLKVGEA